MCGDERDPGKCLDVGDQGGPVGDSAFERARGLGGRQGGSAVDTPHHGGLLPGHIGVVGLDHLDRQRRRVLGQGTADACRRAGVGEVDVAVCGSGDRGGEGESVQYEVGPGAQQPAVLHRPGLALLAVRHHDGHAAAVPYGRELDGGRESRSAAAEQTGVGDQVEQLHRVGGVAVSAGGGVRLGIFRDFGGRAEQGAGSTGHQGPDTGGVRGRRYAPELAGSWRVAGRRASQWMGLRRT